MKIAVRYYSRGGNTKKLADSIAAAVGVEALSVDEPLTEDVDVLFLGSSVYAFDVDKHIKNFVQNLSVHVKKVYNFSTAALAKSTYKQVEKLMAERGISLENEEFFCHGQFGVLHKGHPDKRDCEAAAAFAKKVTI